MHEELAHLVQWHEVCVPITTEYNDLVIETSRRVVLL